MLGRPRWLWVLMLGACSQAHAPFDVGGDTGRSDAPISVDAPDAAPVRDAPDAWVAACEPIDLASAVGDGVYEGTTEGAPLSPILDACGVDVVWRPAVAFRWTAPDGGAARIDTLGSPLSANLLVRRERCDGEPYVCTQQSSEIGSGVVFSVEPGEVFIVLVSPNTPGDPAHFTLNISLGFS